ATMATPHCGMGADGSSAAACRNDRSASRAQKECICASPWSKNFCASGFEVVMARCTVPIPGRIFAGKVGASALGGGAQLSPVLGVCAAATPARHSSDRPTLSLKDMLIACPLRALLSSGLRTLAFGEAGDAAARFGPEDLLHALL